MGKLIRFSQILCLWFLSLHFQVECSSLSPNSPPHLCHPQEHFALLDFNTSISVGNCGFAPRTIQTWNESVDCCLWEGITCNKMTGHVVGLDLSDSCIAVNLTPNSSLFRLEKLQSLNFANNNLSYPNMSFGFHIWKSLTDLNLEGTKFLYDSILFEISLLPKLVSLDLSYISGLHLKSTTFQMLVHNLTELRFLILNSVDMSLVVPSSLLNLTSSLEHLSLSSCNLQGNFPNQVFQLPSLQHLDLSYNSHIEGNLHELNRSSILEYLNLANTNFSGELPPIGNLKLLKELNLYHCQFYESIPRSLANLTEITQLDLRANHLQGQIPDVFGKIQKLTDLSLDANNFSGEIPTSMFNLTHLTRVYLSSNNLTGTITLDMLSKLVHLNELDFSDNSLLSLSNNGTAVNYSFPNLEYLIFSSCNIQKFPSFLRNAKDLWKLDISKNKISGQIHKWEIEGMSLSRLNLSYNFLTGIDLFAFENLMSVDLRSNLLQGSLPILSTARDFMHELYISGNNLTGEIPSSYCNWTSLLILDIANNSLGGKIPECLGNFSHDLFILDLRMNKFHGIIPNSFVNWCELTILNLNGNQLEGILPRSLVNCSYLKVLDVGNNNLNDTFPHWLGVLPSLQVLILQSNRFHGGINDSMPAFYLSKLRIIDVSQNNFTGLLPRYYFKNLTGMRDLHKDEAKLEYINEYLSLSGAWLNYYYHVSVMVIIKGLKLELKRILTTFSTIDFSSNRFHGHIPEELGELHSLHLLNLSHNNLIGQIPLSLGKMAELESLDLSSNKLEGRIPDQLTSLTFLSVLNLSHNKLEGDIPQGKQFNTFSNDSYIGNSGLCGLPLTKKCHKEEEPGAPPSKLDEEEDSAALFEWKFALAGCGCGLVLGLSLGYIVFTAGKPWWVVKKVEKYQEKFVGRWICRHKKRKTQKPNRRS